MRDCTHPRPTIFSLLLTVVSLAAWAQVPSASAGRLILDEGSVAVEDFPVLSYEDKAGLLSPLALDLSSFRLRATSHFPVGYSRSVWWVVFTLENRSDRPLERILHYDDGFMMDSLDEYEVREGIQISHTVEGISVPSAAKYLPDSGAVFPVRLQPGEIKTIYLRIATKSPLLVSLSLYDLQNYQHTRVIRNIFIALIFGAILVMMLSNLFLFFSLRSSEYLYYVVYILGALVYIAGQSGFAIEHWGVYGAARGQLFYSVYVVAVCLLLFSRIVLETKTRMPALDRTILVFAAVNALGIVAGLVWGLHNTLFLQTPLILISSIFLLGVGIAAQTVGTPTAKYFIPATGTFLLSTAASSLLFLGLVPYNFLTRNAYFIGIVIEAVLLSLLLSYRIHLLRQEKMSAQAKILAMESKAREELEIRVAERTRELAVAKKEADALARTDLLTGLKNRRAFFEEGGAEFLRSRRTSRALAVLMCDLDHFKAINDRFGHSGGDEALRVFARTVHQQARASDLVARIGGEEFAVLLPETPREQALVIAERLRGAFEATRGEWEGQPIAFTVSLGLGVLAEEDVALADVLGRADQALYRAKANGRNRVEA